MLEQKNGGAQPSREPRMLITLSQPRHRNLCPRARGPPFWSQQPCGERSKDHMQLRLTPALQELLREAASDASLPQVRAGAGLTAWLAATSVPWGCP